MKIFDIKVSYWANASQTSHTYANKVEEIDNKRNSRTQPSNNGKTHAWMLLLYFTPFATVMMSGQQHGICNHHINMRRDQYVMASLGCKIVEILITFRTMLSRDFQNERSIYGKRDVICTHSTNFGWTCVQGTLEFLTRSQHTHGSDSRKSARLCAYNDDDNDDVVDVRFFYNIYA